MKNKGIIALLSILVIVFVFFAYLLANRKLVSNSNYENEINQVETVSDSDDVDSIERDLDSTEFDNLDSDISNIEAELNSSL